MSSGPTRLEAETERPRPDALRHATEIARRALRADAVFLASEDDDASALSSAGAVGACDAAFALRDAALASSEPVRRDDGVHAWLAIGTRCGALCAMATAPRSFDDDDVATLDALGTLAETLEERPRLPLQSLVDLSGTLLRQAEEADVPAASLLAAADSLDSVARRLRELSAPPARSAAATPGQYGAARILLADDLDLNRKLIADMLSLDGHQVDCVTDGAAAVRAVAAERYDLVLMDMIMPDMDGLAATRAIRALPGPARDVPIVALTANTMRDQLDSCLAAGMDAALTKPMSLDALNAAVAHWTRGRHAAA